eukprot:15807-Chlamydomonas_euryale.AAC.6
MGEEGDGKRGREDGHSGSCRGCDSGSALRSQGRRVHSGMMDQLGPHGQHSCSCKKDVSRRGPERGSRGAGSSADGQSCPQHTGRSALRTWAGLPSSRGQICPQHPHPCSA